MRGGLAVTGSAERTGATTPARRKNAAARAHDPLPNGAADARAINEASPGASRPVQQGSVPSGSWGAMSDGASPAPEAGAASWACQTPQTSEIDCSNDVASTATTSSVRRAPLDPPTRGNAMPMRGTAAECVIINKASHRSRLVALTEINLELARSGFRFFDTRCFAGSGSLRWQVSRDRDG